jgi:hypothetical protein
MLFADFLPTFEADGQSGEAVDGEVNAGCPAGLWWSG